MRMNVIFLDFDGVLDTACYDFILAKDGKPSCDINGRPIFDPRCIRNIKKILDVTLAKIVVTSSWRQFDTLPELRDMWQKREMPGEILDVTPIISDNRGEEIDQWLSGRAEGSINYIYNR